MSASEACTRAVGRCTVTADGRTSVVGRGIGLTARLVAACLLSVLATAGPAEGAGPRTFTTPEEAVRVLTETVKAGDLKGFVALFGPEGQDLVDTSDAATGRRNREVFGVAIAEGWRLVDAGPDRKELVLGNEEWPFPVPLIKGTTGWSFDAAAGREEVLDRRIGRNELAVIAILRTYVTAQRAYASTGHDGKPAGLFARRFGSDPGTQNGLYWPAGRGHRRSPLGELVAQATEEGHRRGTGGQGPSPFHGYYFRILEGQGKAARGGAADYVVDGEMSRGFALIAWPVHYGASGVMTFLVNHDGAVREGPGVGDARGGQGRHEVRPRRHLAPGAGRLRRFAVTKAAAPAAAT
jgi:hypothetical protein